MCGAFGEEGFAPSKSAYPPGLQAACPGYAAFVELCQDPDMRWATTRVVYPGLEMSLPLNFMRSQGEEVLWADGDLRWLRRGLVDSTNYSRSENRGYNYGAFPFVHDGAFHLVGGYGFWRSHADWITFMPELGEWEINRVGGDIPVDQASRACWNSGDTLHWLGLDAVSSEGERTTEWRTLDLASKQWSIRGTLKLPAGLGWRMVFDLEQYVVLLDGSNGFAVLRKSDGLISIESADQWAVEIWKAVHSPGILSCSGDMLVWQTPEGDVWRWDFEERSESTVFMDYFIPALPEAGEGNWPVWPWYAVVGLSGVAVGGMWYRKRQSAAPRDSEQPAAIARPISPVDHWSPAMRALLLHPERELLTSELDELLGIADASSPETLRARRARTVQAVNAEFELLFGYTLIQRERENVDRRKVVYRIAAPPSMVRKLLKEWRADSVTAKRR